MESLDKIRIQQHFWEYMTQDFNRNNQNE